MRSVVINALKADIQAMGAGEAKTSARASMTHRNATMRRLAIPTAPLFMAGPQTGCGLASGCVGCGPS